MDGKKYDSFKPMYNLIDPEFEEGIAYVLTHGALKYEPNNWQKIEPERYIAAIRRHLKEYLTGNAFDEDSGLLHLDHLATDIMFLRWMLMQNPEVAKQFKENIKNQTYVPKSVYKGMVPNKDSVLTSEQVEQSQKYRREINLEEYEQKSKLKAKLR